MEISVDPGMTKRAQEVPSPSGGGDITRAVKNGRQQGMVNPREQRRLKKLKLMRDRGCVGKFELVGGGIGGGNDCWRYADGDVEKLEKHRSLGAGCTIKAQCHDRRTF